MADLFQRRRENLRAVIERLGGASKVAKMLGYKNGAYISQLIGRNPTEELSEKVARNIESKLQLEPGSLDVDPLAQGDQSSQGQLAATLALLVERLSPQAIRSVSAERFGQLCALIFAQHRQGRRLDEEFIDQLVRLAEPS